MTLPLDARDHRAKRVVVACSREHLDELVEQYERRPFVDAELWAGKIARAISRHPDGSGRQDLLEETGLTLRQIEAGLRWQRLELLRRRERLGQEDGAGEEDQ